MDKELYYLIDTDLTLYTIKGKAIKDCFDKCISPLDIVSQVGNETQAELVHELRLQYVKDLENILMNALDELIQYYNEDNKYHFDYYDLLSKLSNWTNSEVLDFLDMFGDNAEV